MPKTSMNQIIWLIQQYLDEKSEERKRLISLQQPSVVYLGGKFIETQARVSCSSELMTDLSEFIREYQYGVEVERAS